MHPKSNFQIHTAPPQFSAPNSNGVESQSATPALSNVSIYGLAMHKNSLIKHVTITVLGYNQRPETIEAAESFAIQLPINEVFALIFSKAGFVDEALIVNTGVPDSLCYLKPFFQNLELVPISQTAGIPDRYLGLPFNTIKYRPERGDFGIHKGNLFATRQHHFSLLRHNGIHHPALDNPTGLTG